MPPPDMAARQNIFKIYTKAWPEADSIDCEYYASRTERYTGADIKALCTEAALQAVRRNHKAEYVVGKFLI